MSIPEQITGVGLGLRPCHYPYIETNQPNIPWFEVLSDNYLSVGGSSLFHLEKITASYPVTLHGVGMSIGSTDPLNFVYLQKLKNLIQITQPQLVSDHLCWTSHRGHYFHELFPLPYTQETITHVVNRIQIIQDFLGRQIMIENVSHYLQFSYSEFNEWDFLKIIAEEANCLILLDLNNVYVSAHNNHFNPTTYLKALPAKRIAQFHLAGYSEQGSILLDTHGAHVYPTVWELFSEALRIFGNIPTAIEWDNNIPDFLTLQNEAKQAQRLMDNHAITV